MSTNFLCKSNGALRTAVRVSLLGSALGLGFGGFVGVAHAAECGAAFKEIRQPFFGDLHVHTSYSFDANYGDGTQNDPWDAYAFATKTAPVSIASFKQGAVLTYEYTKSAEIDRKLDFAAVTDHDSFLNDAIYISPTRVCSRRTDSKRPSMYCPPKDTKDVVSPAWENIQEAANDYNEKCKFTTFIAYEWTKAVGLLGGNDPLLPVPWTSGSELHRNVIFKNSVVPSLPITTKIAPSPSELWKKLDEKCTGSCQALAIPHNPNLSNGFMFPDPRVDADGVALSGTALANAVTYANLQKKYEPLMEIMQNKGASECVHNSFGGEEACSFEERNVFDPLKPGERNQTAKAYARQALGTGLLTYVSPSFKINPYRLGFIGSTDTHNATPGAVREDTWQGHQGALDSNPAYRLIDGLAPEVAALLGGNFVYERLPRTNPGALAVVWARENTRNEIFEALQRRETYATSGPRINLRVFGGWNLGAGDPCKGGEQWLEKAYSSNLLVAPNKTTVVPMGGELSSKGKIANPRFYISVNKDLGDASKAGANLERIEIVKGWIDSTGKARTEARQVYPDPLTFALTALPDSAINPLDCNLKSQYQSAGFPTQCVVWEDKKWLNEAEANGRKNVFYYVRVSEVPSCRWSKRDKLSTSVGTPYLLVPDVIRERAWSSPIWFTDNTQ